MAKKTAFTQEDLDNAYKQGREDVKEELKNFIDEEEETEDDEDFEEDED